ncbi:unnamed protein product, partial [Prorocentrum cordatum]
ARPKPAPPKPSRAPTGFFSDLVTVSRARCAPAAAMVGCCPLSLIISTLPQAGKKIRGSVRLSIPATNIVEAMQVHVEHLHRSAGLWHAGAEADAGGAPAPEAALRVGGASALGPRCAEAVPPPRAAEDLDSRFGGPSLLREEPESRTRARSSSGGAPPSWRDRPEAVAAATQGCAGAGAPERWEPLPVCSKCMLGRVVASLERAVSSPMEQVAMQVLARHVVRLGGSGPGLEGAVLRACRRAPPGCGRWRRWEFLSRQSGLRAYLEEKWRVEQVYARCGRAMRRSDEEVKALGLLEDATTPSAAPEVCADP